MELIPNKVFLDTNVVNFIWEYREQIHENVELPPSLTKRVERDIVALQGIWLTGARANWSFVVSQSTFDEVGRTRNAGKRKWLLRWAREIVIYQSGIIIAEGSAMLAPITTSTYLAKHSDLADRKLIVDAIQSGCNAFCTRDWKTVLRMRDALRWLPLQILAPHEWWESVAPYAPLWT